MARDRMALNMRDSETGRLADELEAIAEHCASLPVLDGRRAEEILGYDDTGLPHRCAALQR
jgi:antitoxin VapB